MHDLLHYESTNTIDYVAIKKHEDNIKTEFYVQYLNEELNKIEKQNGWTLLRNKCWISR